MKVQFVIYCGLTPMTDVVGVFHQEVRAILLAKTYLSSSTIQIVSCALLVLINWL